MSVDLPPEKWVQRTAAEYAQAFNALLPTGPAWPRHSDVDVQEVINGITQIWGDVVESLAATLLVTESDPRKTSILLNDWESAWALPDDCVPESHTTAERTANLVAKITLLGAQSKAFFIGQALIRGYTIAIQEFSPYMCGISRCGDTRNLDDGVNYRWQIGPAEIRYCWTVHVAALTHLSSNLECFLRSVKPAHTILIFDYSTITALNLSQPFNASFYLPMGIL